MAIQLLDPSLQNEFTHISMNDSALDRDADGFQDAWEAFLETGKLPPMKPGDEPTVFRLKPITDAELSAKIKGKLDSIGTAWAVETACYSLVAVENVRDKDGNPFRLEHVMVDGFKKVCKEHQNLLGEQLLSELGQRCIGRQSPS